MQLASPRSSEPIEPQREPGDTLVETVVAAVAAAVLAGALTLAVLAR